MTLDPAEWTALLLSLRVAAVSVALMLVPGVACAWVLARTRFRGQAILDTAIHLPLVLPPVVVGYLLLAGLGRSSWFGGWLHATFGVDIAFTTKAAAIAAAVMGFPLLVRSTRLAMELVDERLEDAARTLGASPWRVFRTITLPLAIPGVVTGVVLAFARSLGEFGATIVFAGNIEGRTRTVSTAIYTALQTPGGDAAAWRLVLVSVMVSFAALLVSESLARAARRRLGVARAGGAS